MKTCIKCKRTLPLSEYHKDKSRSSGYRERCKDCRCKHPKVLKKNCISCGDEIIVTGKAKAKKFCSHECFRVHWRYGINKYQLAELRKINEGNCHICNNPETNIDKRTNKKYSLSIDHCHKTGNVRGILCGSCNNGLGHFKDDPELLMKAIKYVKERGL